jgi:hypothetical protein
MASDVFIRSESMALGGVELSPILSPEFLFLNADRLNFEWDLSREAERSPGFLGGGGGNCTFEVTLVALWGTTMDPGRLRNPEVGREEPADGWYSDGGALGGFGGGVNPLPDRCGDAPIACDILWFWPGEYGGGGEGIDAGRNI